ncbi:MAG: exopolysaccharide Pel transporter PelG [Spirochaetales bacterium]|nr:exopolysaccharide Pel transporter PelG [Spirochaetales bacterium]
MAGIGFRLKKMLSEDTYSALIKGYLFSSVVSSGPWLISVICLSVLGLLTSNSIANSEQNIFGSSIVYIFVFSLIITGISQPVVTRALADELYNRRRTAIGRMFVSLILLTFIVLGVTGIVFISPSDLPLLFKISFVVMLILVGTVWQLMIFLSASSDYKTIVGGFLIGSIMGVLAAYWGGQLAGLIGYFSGFTLGQALICFVLMYKVFEDYEIDLQLDFSFLKYFKMFPGLAVIGLGNYLGTWIDKFVFWWSGVGHAESYVFFAYPLYDAAMFLAFLTAVPAMAHFLIVIETNFYIGYRDFYQCITHKRPLVSIVRKKMKMIADLKKSFGDLFKLQSILLTFLLVFAPQYLPLFNFPLTHVWLFRLAVAGVACYTLVMMISIILLYFDLRKPVVFIYLFLIGTNFLFTIITLFLGSDFHGWGYFLSALISAIVASCLLIYYLKDLEYHSFINQPVTGITGEKEKLPNEACGVEHIRFGKVNRIG